MKQITLKQFQSRFPNDDSCLEHLKNVRYGEKHNCKSCGKKAKYYRVSTRRSYSCEHCGNQIYPTAGTPFENTRTPLTDWFHVMFMFTKSRNGVSAKEVQRTIGVTYKTAWRMCNLIRHYMGYVDGDTPLGGTKDYSGIVEIDEAYIGGKDKRGEEDKAVVLGMVERGRNGYEGNVIARHIPSRANKHILPEIAHNVVAGSKIATDTAPMYNSLTWNGYWHKTVNHSQGEYVRGNVHTNTVEGFWSNVKRSINGTYIKVSDKWLQTYLWEFEYRYNFRKRPQMMMELLLQGFPKVAS